jgi:hypothetical protein
LVVTQLFDLNARIQQLTWSLIFYEKYSTSLSTIVLMVLTTANFGGFSNFCRYYTWSQAGKSTGPLWNPWTSLSTHISNFDDIRQCWTFAVLWWPFWKWRPVEKIFNGGNQFGTSLSTHISNFDDIRQCWIVAAILKMVAGRNFSMSGHHIYPHIKFWWYRTILNFCCPFFMPCFGSHFENGRHLENFENTELLL